MPAPESTLPRRWWRALGHGWTWRMAWRDSRTQRGRLLIFSLSIVAGVAALVAIHLLRSSLRGGLETQARALLGADLHLSTREGLPPETSEKMRARARRTTHELSFTSMLFFPASGGARLVQVRGLEGEYPYYGKIESLPPEAWAHRGEKPGVFVEPALLDQFGAKVGEVARLGTLELPILGSLPKPPPHSGRFGGFAPEVFVRLGDLDRSGLLGRTSLTMHHYFFELAGPEEARALRRDFAGPNWRYETPEDRREALGKALDHTQQFLSLVAMAALILGAIGVASAMQAHLARRAGSVAILRCLGCPGEAALAIYLAQAALLALCGAGLGALCGLALHRSILSFYRESFPVEISLRPDWAVVGQTTAAGLLVCAGFALVPLLRVRTIPPAAALREVGPAPAGRGAWLVWLGLALLLTGLNVREGSSWPRAAWMTAAQGLAFLVLALTARALAALARRLPRPGWPYLLRQGVANLHRPRNQTLLFLLSLGLGTFLLCTILLSRQLLLQKVSVRNLAESPNIYLVDVQEDQVSGVEALLAARHLPRLENAPMITMRIAAVRGQPVRALEKSGAVPKWVLQREFRSTWRGELSPTEKITAGAWVSALPAGGGPVPLSLEQDIARDLHVAVGDAIDLDVQGVPIRARVTSLREVDWSRFNLNFFMVFPPGALEGAPGFHVVTTRVPAGQSSGELQRALVQEFPNVSAIDLNSIIATVRNTLEKVARVVSVLAGFTVLAALPILIGTLLNGRDQRVRESVLLRTLGASARQVRIILLVEYAVLGLLSGLTGVLLAVGANAALAHWIFEASPWPDGRVLLSALASTTALALLAGWGVSRGITRHSPLVILRSGG